MSQEELNTIFDNLNQFLNKYLNNYISDIVRSIDTLLSNYEYEPDEWDLDRAIESGNIYSKLAVIVNKSRLFNSCRNE